MTQLVLVEPDGRVAVHDADSGALVRAGRVSSAPDGVAYRFAQVVAGLLLVDGASGEVTAYGLDRLDRRWSVPVDPRAGAWFIDCAGMVCLRDQVGARSALDPATGRPSWADDRWVGVRPGRRPAARRRAGGRAGAGAVGAGTGDRPGRSGGSAGGGSRAAKTGPAGAGCSGCAGTSPGTGRSSASWTWRPGEARIRAVLPGSWDECADAGAALVCLRPSGGLVGVAGLAAG